jgi:hypothetical protein
MTQAAFAQSVQKGEVVCLPRALIIEAEKLLAEVRPLDRNSLTLDVLSYYRQELVLMIKSFPKDSYHKNILAELKTRCLAFIISIEKRQTHHL